MDTMALVRPADTPTGQGTVSVMMVVVVPPGHLGQGSVTVVTFVL